MKNYWSTAYKGVTKEQSKDTGMALVLLLLLGAYLLGRRGFVVGAIIVHVVNMTAPQLFRPAAVIWFGFAHVLGLVVSRVVLTIIFFAVVTPMAAWRRLTGADSLQLKALRASRGSVMFERNHRYTGKDIEQPY
jgi:hypothetical protein